MDLGIGLIYTTFAACCAYIWLLPRPYDSFVVEAHVVFLQQLLWL
jgi:hypothetical protein